MSESNGRNGMGKIAITAVISILAASGFWNILYQFLTRDMVSRGEVQVMIQQSGPYIEDRKVIMQGIAELKEGQKYQTLQLQKLSEEISAAKKSK